MSNGFGEHVSFRMLTDEPLDVTSVQLSVRENQVILTAQLNFPDWQRVLKEGLFHLDDEQEPAGFKPDLPVQLSLRLRAALAAQWLEDAEGMSMVLQDENSALRHTEAWLATEIVQDVKVPSDIEGVSYLQVGAKTRWAKPLFPPEAEADTVIERLETFLTNEDWPFVRAEENMVRFPAGVGEGRSWVVVAVADEENQACTIYSIHMKKVPPSQHSDTAQWMATKNYALGHGCFDMNADTGEVRFRSTFPACTRNQITAGVQSNFSVMAANLDTLVPFFQE